MKIKWLAHAAFLLTSDDGTRIITDPYETGNGLNHGKIEETADIVTVSHDHFDHCNVAVVKGNPHVVRDTTETKGINIRGIPTASSGSDVTTASIKLPINDRPHPVVWAMASAMCDNQ